MSEIVVRLPAVSEDKVSSDLRDLTRILMESGAQTTGGLLGGEYGYGVYYENDVFMMHPYCWCEGPTCPWCLNCICWDGTEPDCRHPQCNGGDWAPHFLHKPSGSSVRWYKYIGRGMELDLKVDWRSIYAECIASLGGDA